MKLGRERYRKILPVLNLPLRAKPSGCASNACPDPSRRLSVMDAEPSLKSNPSLVAIRRPLKAFDYIRRYGLAGFVEQFHH